MNRIKELRLENKYTQKDIADYLQTSESAVSLYENHNREPDVLTLVKLGSLFGVPLEYIAGVSDEPAPQNYVINVYGRIPAGEPIEAINEIIDTAEIPLNWTKGNKTYIGLIVKGDSMYPFLIDGDLAIILLQTDFINGDICAVYVNGYNATLKKVYKNVEGTITLVPMNSNYAPVTHELGNVQILGKVVEVRRNLLGVG